jgi:hypothetical protein
MKNHTLFPEEAFCETFYEKGTDDQRHMISHEIAHYVSGRSNEGISDEDFYSHKQDKEANALVEQWFADYEKHMEGD